MSIRYSNVKGILHQQRMHKHFIDQLIRMGVTHSQIGHRVSELDYDEAKYEYMLATFREIDAEKENNKWF